uniref:Peptidase C1A papain C-terminal domain-containing protein n=1 Tax=Eubacterium plexicaudatum ASF492 TaxID=1235802 RepID=N2A806_9FIRM
MHEWKRYVWFAVILGILMLFKFEFIGQNLAHTEKVQGANLRKEEWDPIIAEEVNQMYLAVHIDGRKFTNLDDGIYLDDARRMMLPIEILRDGFDCGAHLYDQQLLIIEKREDVLEFEPNKNYYIRNKEKIKKSPAMIRKNDRFYLPLELLMDEFGYVSQWDMEENMVVVQSMMPDDGVHLPYRYDLRDNGRAPKIRDQGPYGTCWAFASLTALESALLPETEMQLSVDHMNHNHSFTSSLKDGGQYTMAMAYLAAWQGPVLEKDDPYGDGRTDSSLTAVKHVQDMHIIDAKNLDGIKKAVFQYGGVESCIYTTLQNADGDSPYYNREKYAYCYKGEEKPNHDVVIIGWDDSFPREYFKTDVADDGALICQNSWGSDFGDDGVFYVSYYDTNIGTHNLVFTGVEDADNYDKLYQSDLCGWVGQMGYNKESIYGANVFMAEEEEDIAAAGFYTTGKNTSYQVYIVPEFADISSMDSRILVAEGRLSNAGYHTIRFDQSIRVAKNRKFAVVVWLSTPNEVRPMAIEYAADELTQEVNLEDGEGYVSAQGKIWSDVKESSDCNLCIKAYARRPWQQTDSLPDA